MTDIIDMVPQGTSNANSEAAHKEAGRANGVALAELIIKEGYRQAATMLMFLKNIAELTQEGRTAMRARFKEEREQFRIGMQSLEKESSEYEIAKRALNTLQVRMSEAEAFSKACDAGFSDWEEQGGYAEVIAASRMVLQGQATNGPTVRRGRKSKAGFLKLVTYISGLESTSDEDKRRIELVKDAMQKIIDDESIVLE